MKATGKMATWACCLSTLFMSCGIPMWSNHISYNFERDKVMVATVDSAMIRTVEQRRGGGEDWPRLITELGYGGKQGTVINLYYKESPYYRVPMELTYDLKDNDIITFRTTKIKIVEATSSEIRYIVLESPLYRYKSGGEFPERGNPPTY